MIIDNFLNRHENKKIIVRFASKIIENVPKTSQNTKIGLIAGVVFVFGIVLVVIGKKKPKKKKELISE